MAESYKFSHWGSTSEDILKSHFPLHRACRDGDVEALSTLLVEAQHGVYVEDSFYGWTPAHWAAYFGKLACLRKLMQVTRVGAECDVKSSRFCQTPAHLAAFGGHPQCLLWLLQAGAGIDCQDYLGETPAHKAARTGSMECTSLLVSHSAKLFIKNISGATPSELAQNCGHVDCSKFLESALVSQENVPRGVYQQRDQQSTSSITMVACAGDVTTAPHGGSAGSCSEPGAVEIVQHSQDLEMEDDSMDATASAFTDTALSRLFAQHPNSSSDVTLDPAISTNQMPVAGRKRTREDAEEVQYKRQRTSVLPCDPQFDIFCSPEIALDHDDQSGYHDDENGYRADENGYHDDGMCNGGSAVAYPDENVNPNTAAMMEAQMLECSAEPRPAPKIYKCVALGDVVGVPANTAPKVAPSKCNGNSHVVDGTGDKGMDALSSEEEHHESIVMCQGYDSMCYEAMYSHP